MKAALKKIYTLIPLVIVVFFFQNCSNKQDSHAGVNHASYEGYSNVDGSKLKE